MRVKCRVETPSGINGDHFLDEVNEQLMCLHMIWLMNALGWKINSFIIL